MKKFFFVAYVLCAMLLILPDLSYAESAEAGSVIVATGQDVPPDDHLPEEYRFPAKYRDNAVQFRTEDGVLLCGWVLGEGSKGITLAHANGWMTNSWLPFGERLVDAGYMVIIWEFRNIAPSGNASPGEELRWDLDVLAAAQVLRERGAVEILAIGASDGGTATAVAAPHIPELVGLGILSSPARSKGDGVAAVGNIEVPAFFAVSDNDPGGKFLPEVQSLYDACASEQKELHILTSYEHGTDLLSDIDVYSRKIGSTEAQKEERRQLANNLMRFVNDSFGVNENDADDDPVQVITPNLRPTSGVDDTPVQSIAPSTEPTSGVDDAPAPSITPNPEPPQEADSGPVPVISPSPGPSQETGDANDYAVEDETPDASSRYSLLVILITLVGITLLIIILTAALRRSHRKKSKSQDE
jgi:esterase/lipase